MSTPVVRECFPDWLPPHALRELVRNLAVQSEERRAEVLDHLRTKLASMSEEDGKAWKRRMIDALTGACPELNGSPIEPTVDANGWTRHYGHRASGDAPERRE